MLLGNCYQNFPEYYDILYARYLKSVPDFVTLVKRNTPQGGLILDLAAGTGGVSLSLLKDGFQVTSLDLNKGMLEELKIKAGKLKIDNYSVVVDDMSKIKYRNKFDVICIRQAINYFLGLLVLQKGLRKIFKALKSGGKFIFNAPNYQGQRKYPVVHNFYQQGDLNAFVLEMNKMKKRILKHQQYSLVWKKKKEPQFIMDENSFFMFKREEFQEALGKAGFSKIKFSGSDKTLYCVATK